MKGNDSINKLFELTGADHYVNWRRPNKVTLQRKDVGLFDLANRLGNTNTVQSRRWVKANVRANETVTLKIYYRSLAEVSATVDDVKKQQKILGKSF